MDEQAIQKLQQLIQKLQQAKAGMQEGSRAAVLLTNQLAELGKQAEIAQAGGIKNLTQQVDRLEKAIAEGGRARLGSFRGRFAYLQTAQKDMAAEAKKIQDALRAGGPNNVVINERYQGEETEKERLRRQNQEANALYREQRSIAKMNRDIEREERKRALEEEKQDAKVRRDLRKQERDPLQYVSGLNAEKRAEELRIQKQMEAAEKASNENLREQIRLYPQLLKNKQEAAALSARENLGSYLTGGDLAAQNANRLASAADPRFTPETIKRIETFGNGNFSRISYQFQEADGIVRKLNVTVDRFGKALVDTQRRFRTFGDNVARDIQEVAKWSIAVAVVYGPMQKLQEIMDLMIRNETALADITVSLGDAQRDVNEIFASAAEIAQATGESIDGVLEAYNTAYRAAGGAAEGTQRYTLANKLLSDAIVLSKLSTLDQAEAIDVLAAALKQSGMDLSRGTELLDKWVRTTKVANVDLSTLALGFTVVGDAADAVGIKAEKLNAILATISETSNSSGKEVANTAKAIVSGFQSDNARKALTNLGIALEDTSGQAREFTDVLQQIYELRKTGAIDNTAFSKLTLALGGGTRRQAVWSTFIENFERVGQIEAAQSGATGDAAEALGRKLDTVQTSITRLSNAFQSLAQSLGESGGLLDVFKFLVDGATVLTSAVSDLLNVLGKAGPVLVATLAAFKYVNMQTPLKKEAMLAQFGGLVSGAVTRIADPLARGSQTNGMMFAPMEQRGIQSVYSQSALMAGQRAGRWAANNAGTIAAGAGVAFSAIENIAQGKPAQAAGNAIGAAIGFYLGGPIAAVIGSAIGEGFVNTVTSFAPEFGTTKLGASLAGATPPTTKEEEDKQTAQELVLKALGSNPLSPWAQNTPEGAQIVAGQVMGLLYKAVIDGANAMNQISQGTPLGKITATSQEDAALIALQSKYEAGLVSQADYDAAIKALQQVFAKQIEDQRRLEEEKTRTNEFVSNNEQELYYAKQVGQQMLREDLLNKQIGQGVYKTGQARLEALPTLGANLAPMLGDLDGFIGKLARVVSRASEEDLGTLNNLAQEGNKTEVVNFFNQLLREIESRAQPLDVVNLREYQRGDSQKIIAEAIKQQTESFDAQREAGALTGDQIAAKIESLPSILVQDAAGFFKEQKLDPAFISIAEQQLKELGIISKNTANDGLDFQTFDVTKSQLEAVLQNQYPILAKRLESMGAKIDPQEIIAITSEGYISNQKADWKIVQYLLQQILDVNEKQLDGMYNLPEGSSFYVPYNAAKYGLNQQGGGAGSILEELLRDTGTTTSRDMDRDRRRREEDERAERRREERENTRRTILSGRGNAQVGAYSDIPRVSGTASASVGSETSVFSSLRDIISTIGNNLSTKLNLQIENRTTLMLDGRIVAQMIAPYLAQMLARYAGGTGSGRVVLTR